MAVCIGIADKTDLMITALPALLRSLDFQEGRRSFTLSTNCYKSFFDSFFRDRGTLKYLVGKGSNLPGKWRSRETLSSRLH